mgnify:CR=1 FL=1
MIHPQLLADCHVLGTMPSGVLLLNQNAIVPWFILVPDSDLEDVLDLSPGQLKTVLEDCQAVSSFVKQQLGFAKVNFAGLGNVVPQMHLHIIGRAEGDDCWPQPVWGNLNEVGEYAPKQLIEWRRKLSAAANLVVV